MYVSTCFRVFPLALVCFRVPFWFRVSILGLWLPGMVCVLGFCSVLRFMYRSVICSLTQFKDVCGDVCEWLPITFLAAHFRYPKTTAQPGASHLLAALISVLLLCFQFRAQCLSMPRLCHTDLKQLSSHDRGCRLTGVRRALFVSFFFCLARRASCYRGTCFYTLHRVRTC